MNSLPSKSQKPAHNYSWSLCEEEEEEETHEALPNTRTLVKAAQKLHTKGCILLLPLLLLLLGFTKCVNQQAPAKNLAKDKCLQAKKTQSFLHNSLISFLWMGGCNGSSLSGFWVGAWIYFLKKNNNNFFYLYLLNVCWNVWWNVCCRQLKKVYSKSKSRTKQRRMMMVICWSP
jgi:hypothetical protein